MYAEFFGLREQPFYVGYRPELFERADGEEMGVVNDQYCRLSRCELFEQEFL